MRVLHRLVHRRDLGLARAWLRGDSLTAENLATLGVADDAFAEEDPEYSAREMVLALARLAGARMPIVLCFDQVEALEIIAGDLSGFRAFGAAASLLHAETSNLVLISCAQSSLENMFRSADYDRIAERQATLQLLGQQDGMRLIQARLAAAGVEWNPPAEFQSVFKWEGRASARAILAKAAELFDGKFEPSAANVPIDEFLQQEWDRRVSRAAEWLTEGDADEVLDQGIPVLLAITHPEWKPARGSRDVDVNLESQTGALGVSLCNHRNMNSLAARFRRLGASASGAANARLVVVRDPRLPIGKSARVTRGRLDQLMRSGARLVHPSIEALQALEALRTLLADARAGDLTHNGETVPVRTLEQWMARHLPRSLGTLAEEITGKVKEPAGYARIREDLLAMLEQRCVVTLEEAARETRHEAEAMRRVAHSSPDLAGLLEGPPAVLYRIVPANV